MEPSPTAHRPQTSIVAGLDVDQMLSRLTTIAMRLSRPTRDSVEVWPRLRRSHPARPPRKEAWRSYAVYSGALSLRHYKSSRRLP
jgi:hypothetical protein